jgi:hypothetical protein
MADIKVFTAIRKFLGRITGISTPFGGISWEPQDPHVRKAEPKSSRGESRQTEDKPAHREVLLLGRRTASTVYMTPVNVKDRTATAEMLIRVFWSCSQMLGKTLEDVIGKGLPEPPETLILFHWKTLERIDSNVAIVDIDSSVFLVIEKDLSPFAEEVKKFMVECCPDVAKPLARFA